VEELIMEVNNILKRTHLEKYAHQNQLMERISLSVGKKLTDFDPE
jgi:hypothetical protein